MNNAIEHNDAFELLPWLANGSLTADEREGLERHVRECLTCRAELKEQRALRGLVLEHPTVHLSAEQELKNLHRRLESTQSATLRVPTSGLVKIRRLAGRLGRLGRRGGPWRMLAAAGIAAAAVGGVAWLATPVADRAPAYRGLSQDSPQDIAYVDIIFAEGTTEAQMRSLLEDLGGDIAGGPSGLGRYTIRLESPPRNEEEADALIRSLLEDRRVRFAGRGFMPVGSGQERP